MKQLINDILNNQDDFIREMIMCVALLGAFSIIAMFCFAVWGNV